jgi:hypothetical protein
LHVTSPRLTSPSLKTTGGTEGDADSVPQFFDFNVPATAAPGSEMTATSPDGTEVKFVVPAGSVAGGTVRLQY